MEGRSREVGAGPGRGEYTYVCMCVLPAYFDHYNYLIEHTLATTTTTTTIECVHFCVVVLFITRLCRPPISSSSSFFLQRPHCHSRAKMTRVSGFLIRGVEKKSNEEEGGRDGGLG